MNYNYFVADVFTREVFNGAQVAVFPDANGLTHRQMSLVARELNLSETVFLFKSESGDKVKKMKIFSPLAEIDMAGHPVVAAAYVLAGSGGLALSEGNNALVFEQNSGPVEVNVTGKDGKPGFIQFTRRVVPTIDFFSPTESELAGFLGIEQAHIDHKKYSARLVSCGMPYLVVPCYYYETVRRAKFNYPAWSQSIAPQTAAQEIILFSAKTPFQDSDFNVRLLGPNISMHEDPPVGSAMPAFASYLCSFDHMRKGTYTFAVDRGDEKVRRSVLNLEMDHKKEDQLTLRVGGQAVLVAQGTMNIPSCAKSGE